MAPAELRVGRRNVRVTHPDKLLFPGAKLTKLDLARHYERVAPVMLPYVLEALLDSSPKRRDRVKRVDSEPKPAPSGAELLAGAMLERAYVPEVMGAISEAVTSPRNTASGALRTAAGLAGLARAAVSQAPVTPYNAPVGPHRSFSWQRSRWTM